MKDNRWIRTGRIAEFMIFDMISIVLPYGIAVLMLKLSGNPLDTSLLLWVIPFIVTVKLMIYYGFGFYKMLVRHFGFEDVIKMIIVISFTNLLVVIYIALSNNLFMYKSFYIFMTMAEIAFILAPRLLNRFFIYVKLNYKWVRTRGKRTMIIGAGGAGELAVKEIYRNSKLNNIPVIFLDDDPKKYGKKLLGINIIGPTSLVSKYIEDYDIAEVIIAIKDYPKEELRNLFNLLNDKNIRFKQIEVMTEYQANNMLNIVDVKIEDYLNREVVQLEDDRIASFISGEVVLVTGGGGSIGSELCRQIAKLHPKKLIIFDIYENNAYDIQMELQRAINKGQIQLELVVIIGSVYNETRLEEVFALYQPTLIFHAAAYKHVPLMEHNAVEGIRTNVFGTYHAARLASKYKAKKFILVSSDKAVRPTNVMGATKRYAELIIQVEQEKQTTTQFSAVRFGNVLGSNGSVIPLFKKQIEDGGPVTVTHAEITRYFMTIPEAAGLILQCGVYANGGEVFVLDMGKPILIKDLAEKMIRLSGHEPYQDIDIIFTGLRPGEKLYEELLINGDGRQEKTENKKIFIEKQRDVTSRELNLEYLREHFEKLTNEEIKQSIASVIKTYHIDESNNK